MRIAMLLFCGLIPWISSAQSSIAGKWKSIDDGTGEPKSIVELAERNGKIFGKIVRIYTKTGGEPDPVCDKCSHDDPRFDQKVIGMEIITGMVKHDDAWGGGEILDPESGKIYSCKLWIENDKLKVRGYIGPFFRTQTWLRAQ